MSGTEATTASGRRVVYLFPYPPDEHADRTYGFSQLASAGFDVEVLDLSAMVLPGRAGQGDELSVPVRRIADLRALSAYLDSVGSAVFIDYVGGLEPPLPGLRVLSQLGSCECPYVIVSAAALPPLPAPRSAREQFGRRMRRLPQASDPRRLAGFIATRARRLLKATPRVPLPALVFATRSPYLEGYVARTGLAQDRVVPINSFDYDAFLQYKRDTGALPAQEQFALFLDEAASNHPDFELLGTKRFVPSDAAYSASMRRLFDEVERNTGLRVVVAAHPRSDYESQPGFFGDREVVRGRTLDLVARSRFVIGHSTTALSYAVLLRRPILLTTTAEMDRSIYALQIARMEGALGLSAVNIDRPDELAAVDWNFANWPTEGFADYESRYIHSPDADPDRTTWQIVGDRLQAGV